MVPFSVARTPSIERPMVSLRGHSTIFVFRAHRRGVGYGWYLATTVVCGALSSSRDRTRGCLLGWISIRSHTGGVVRTLVENHGGEWTTETNRKGPTAYRVTGKVPIELLRSVVDGIKRDGGFDWYLSDQPDKAIAGSLPALWDVVTEGPQVDNPPLVGVFRCRYRALVARIYCWPRRTIPNQFPTPEVLLEVRRSMPTGIV